MSTGTTLCSNFNKLAHQLSHLLRPTRYTMMKAVNSFNNPTLWKSN